jgi:hypothetical protein
VSEDVRVLHCFSQSLAPRFLCFCFSLPFPHSRQADTVPKNRFSQLTFIYGPNKGLDEVLQKSLEFLMQSLIWQIEAISDFTGQFISLKAQIQEQFHLLGDLN